MIGGYVLLAALCRPLTVPALVAVLIAGVPLFWYGVRRRPRAAQPVVPRRAAQPVGRRSAAQPVGRRRAAQPVGRRSAAVWLGIGALAAAYEVGLRLGPNDTAHPTLSTLADPALATYPGRVLAYLVWTGAGVWLVTR